MKEKVPEGPKGQKEDYIQRITVETSVDPMLFLREMEEQHPEAFLLMKLSGSHPEGIQNGEQPINIYTGEPIVDDSFENVGRHNIAVALAAGEVVRELGKRGKLEKSQVIKVVDNALLEDAAKTYELMRERTQVGKLEQAFIDGEGIRELQENALIHDATKPFEIMRSRAAKEGKIDVDAVYGVEAYRRVEETLINLGIEPTLARKLKEAGKETGHNSLSSYIELGEDGNPRLKAGDNIDEEEVGDIIREIVHLADDMTASTKPTEDQAERTVYRTPLERMEEQNFRERYPWMYKEGFGFDDERNIIRVDDVENIPEGVVHAHTYAQWQDWVSRQICAKVKKAIDPNDLSAPDVWMKEFINERVQLKQARISGRSDQQIS